MGIEYILAFAFLANLKEDAPQQIAPYADRSAWMAEAEKRNRTDVRLRADDVRAKGGEFVCLKVERVSI